MAVNNKQRHRIDYPSVGTLISGICVRVCVCVCVCVRALKEKRLELSTLQTRYTHIVLYIIATHSFIIIL